MIFESKKAVTQTHCKAKVGYFALEDGEWERCRERFCEALFNKCYGLYFCHELGQSKSVASFLHKTEQIIFLAKPYGYSAFAETDMPNVLWVNLSPFWYAEKIRLQVLTLILRCGLNFTGDYDDALWSTNYTRSTKNAMLRFLFGFTSYTGKRYKNYTRGWVKIFENKDERYVISNLKNPEAKSFYLGYGKLWSR